MAELARIPLTPPSDRIISDKEYLTEQYNYWRGQLIERLVTLKQGELEKQRNPNANYRDVTSGDRVSILDVVEGRKSSVREARQHVDAIQALLDAGQAGKLKEEWSDEALMPLPTLTLPTKR